MHKKAGYIKDLLWFFFFWGMTAAIFRMWFGLGATTNLSDEMPWGLWKILNMIAGVALSTSGFTVGFLVYVLKLERFRPLVRPAILVAFLGYGSSCLALLFDIGLPDKFWHPFFYWNEHSFLFEVFWCVILYFTVTFVELSPNILERYKLRKLVEFFHKIAPGVVIVGISLSSLHHSSLGSLFLTTPLRLHELWYTPWLPLMFIISAMGGGMMFLIVVKMFYARLYDPVSVFGREFKKDDSRVCSLDGRPAKKTTRHYGPDMPMLSRLAVIASSLMGVYLLLKAYDLISRNQSGALLAGTWESILYSFELLFTAVIPILLVSFSRTRRSPYGIGIAAFSGAFGLVMNRMDVGMFGYFRDAGVVYFPSLAEWSLSIGVVSAAALAFMFISENFTIFDKNWSNRVEKGAFRAAFDSFSRVWLTALQNGIYRVSIIGVFVVPFAFIVMYPPYSGKKFTGVKPASGVDVNRAFLLINGNSDDEAVVFPHEEHRQRLGKEKSCVKCHHINMPGDKSTPCARCHRHMLCETGIFDHDEHLTLVADENHLGGIHPENYSCSYCHPAGMEKTAQNAKSCTECHSDDMNLKNNPSGKLTFLYANSYMDAMHKTCIPCHQKENKSFVKAGGKNTKLDDCTTCHKKENMLNDKTKISFKENTR